MNTARLKDGEYVRLPRNRKIVLTILLSFDFITLVLVIVSLIRPVPQFSTSGALLQVQAQDALQFSKRWLWAPPDDQNTLTGLTQGSRRASLPYLRTLPAPAATAYTLLSLTPHLTPSMTAMKRWNDRWDPAHIEVHCACTAGHTSTTTSTSTSTTTSKKLKKKKPHTTTVTAISTPTVETTSTSSPTPTPPANTGTTAAAATADINDFVAMWIGILGVCLQRAAGTLVCTGASFTPNYGAIYEQSGLSEPIRAVLPSGTKGASIGLLIAAMSYGVCLLLFTVAVLPSSFSYTPMGQRSLDSHHQWVLSVASIIAAIGFFSALGSTIVMRNIFQKMVKAIPALDPRLLTKTGSGFQQLYAISVFGGLILVACLALVAEDARYPWWYQADRVNEGPAGQQLAPPLDFSARRPANPFGGPSGGGQDGQTVVPGMSMTGFGGATPAMGGPMSFVNTPAQMQAMSYAPSGVM